MALELYALVVLPLLLFAAGGEALWMGVYRICTGNTRGPRDADDRATPPAH
jgi:hypothetical protein